MSGVGSVFLRSLFESAAAQGVQALSSSTDGTDSTGSVPKVDDKAAVSGDFESTLKAILTPDASQNVSEEELFAALTTERVAKLKGPDVAAKFKEAVTKFETDGQRGDYVPFEVAAKQALRQMRTDGVLSADEADSIYAQAFSAAQLDADNTALWDDHSGGPNDPTMAVMDMTKAIALAKSRVEAFDAGKEKASVRSVDEAEARPNSGAVGSSRVFFGNAGVGSAVPASLKGDKTIVPRKGRIDGGGGDGFLFKPLGEHSKKLVVLIPQGMVPYAKGVTIRNEDGKVIERGRGLGDPGYARKFDFRKSGARYPKNITVEVTLMDGSVKSYKIPNPAKRYD